MFISLCVCTVYANADLLIVQNNVIKDFHVMFCQKVELECILFQLIFICLNSFSLVFK